MTNEAYAAIENYLAKIKAGGEIKKGVGFFYTLPKKGYEGFANIPHVRLDDPDKKVVNWFTTPEFIRYMNIKASWYKKGYIRHDILTAQDARADDGKKDGSVIWIHDMDESTAEVQSKVKGFPIDVIPLDANYRIDSGLSPTSTALFRKCKNPELAIQFLQLINTEKGKELYNILTYGLEGKHYNKKDDNTIEIIKPATNTPKYGLTNWIVGNTFNGYNLTTDMLGYKDYVINVIHKNASVSPFNGFVLNIDPIKLEITQTDAVIKEFEPALVSGAIADYKAKYDEFIKKLEIAGANKIVEETQRQLNSWLKK